MVATFLPLVPVLLIFLRKIYLKESIYLLVILCLLSFLEGLVRSAPSLTEENQQIIHHILLPLLLLVYAQLFRSNLPESGRSLLNILLTAFLSAVITYWSVKGWERTTPFIDILSAIALILLILASLPSIIHNSQLYIFHSPLFWIAGGTLFELLLYLLVAWTCPSFSPGTLTASSLSAQLPEKTLFLALAVLARFALYTIGVLTYRPEKGS